MDLVKEITLLSTKLVKKGDTLSVVKQYLL